MLLRLQWHHRFKGPSSCLGAEGATSKSQTGTWLLPPSIIVFEYYLLLGAISRSLLANDSLLL